MKKIGKLFLVGMMTFIGMMLSMKVQAADMRDCEKKSVNKILL